MAAADLIQAFREQCDGGVARLFRHENGWALSLGACRVFTESLWRLISDGHVAVTSEDDGHPFGRPHPLDAEAEANSRLADEAISSLEIDRATGDLIVRFTDGKRLQILTTFSGYEGWMASFRMGDEDVDLVCGGGGALSVVRVATGTSPPVVVGEPIDPAD